MTTNAEKPRAPRIAIFNHKGGVGKTTLTVNLAAAMTEVGHRVLLVDSDPQCNLTSYLVEESVVNDLLDKSDLPEGNTLWSAVKPLVESIGELKRIQPIEFPDRLSLLAGDIRLAEFETELLPYWSECFQRRPRGFRGTTAVSRTIDYVLAEFPADIVFYDTGPNIGPLNRAILLDCDYFIVPAACDLFSLRAISTLGHQLANWAGDWSTIAQLAPDGIPLLPGLPRVLGYVTQRFRVYANRPSTAYAELVPRLEKAIQEDLLTVLRRVNPQLGEAALPPLRLGEVKDFSSLANAAQNEGVAIWRTSKGTQEQRDEAKETFGQLAKAVLSRIAQHIGR